MGGAEASDRLLALFAALDAALAPFLGGEVEHVQHGLPTLVSGAEPVFRGPDVLAEVSLVPDDGLHGLAIVLSSAQALDAVERVLGGREATGGTRAPSDAECGLLGYGLARALAAAPAALGLRDVRHASAGELAERARGQLLWSLVLAGRFGRFELRFLLSPALARRVPLRFAVRALLHATPAADALAGLEPGAVLLGERFLLTPTSAGLAGSLTLDAAGTLLEARLEDGQIRAGHAQMMRDDELVLVLAEREASLWELAELASGRSAAFAQFQPGPVTLERQGRVLGEGELVTYRGALGVRITRCDSAGSPAPPPA